MAEQQLGAKPSLTGGECDVPVAILELPELPGKVTSLEQRDQVEFDRWGWRSQVGPAGSQFPRQAPELSVITGHERTLLKEAPVAGRSHPTTGTEHEEVCCHQRAGSGSFDLDRRKADPVARLQFLVGGGWLPVDADQVIGWTAAGHALREQGQDGGLRLDLDVIGEPGPVVIDVEDLHGGTP